MRVPRTLRLLLALAGSPALLAGQGPLVLELRGGAALPLASFRSGGDVGSGPSFGLHFSYQRTARRSFYAGFAQTRFGCDLPRCAADSDFVSTGWTVGSRFSLRPLAPVAPWLRVGAVFDRVEGDFTGSTVAVRRVSDLGFGGEVGSGARVRFGRRVSASPGVTYTMLNTRFPEEGHFRMRYLVADLGLVIGL